MQAALQNVEGVSAVEMDLPAKKAMAKTTEKQVVNDPWINQLVSAVDETKGMAKYSATIVGGVTGSGQ